MYCPVCGSQRPVCHKNPFETSVPSDSVRSLEFYYLGKDKLLGWQDSQKPRFTAGISQKNLSINNELSEVKSLSSVRLFATLWTIAHQAPPSMVHGIR